jgi:ectoine hydroxylase-related dioxygenase (phytanoyl-CoA dioxygenase family)
LDHVPFYRENGYAVVRNVFAAADIAELSTEFEGMKSEGLKHRASFRHKNVLYVIGEDPRLGRILRFLQWPAYVSDILQDYRVDRRLLEIVEPLIGNHLKQIINQLIWKPPGAEHTSYGFHQDCRFRRPATAYRHLATSYVQTAIAVDPHRPENGCMRVYPRSHTLGDLAIGLEGSVYNAALDENALRKKGLDPEDLVDLVLDPGDVALWNPYTVHGSGPNLSAIDRRSYVNGYVIAQNCDRGEWAFRDGKPCALGEPVLVQYDDLFTRPEPHYVEGPPHPFRDE